MRNLALTRRQRHPDGLSCYASSTGDLSLIGRCCLSTRSELRTSCPTSRSLSRYGTGTSSRHHDNKHSALESWTRTAAARRALSDDGPPPRTPPPLRDAAAQHVSEIVRRETFFAGLASVTRVSVSVTWLARRCAAERHSFTVCLPNTAGNRILLHIGIARQRQSDAALPLWRLRREIFLERPCSLLLRESVALSVCCVSD